MNSTLYRLEVIKGKEGIAEEWLSFLKANKEKAMITLEKEKVYFETYFKEVIEDQMYIYLFIMCENLDFANSTAFESTNELDIKHFEYMKLCINLKRGKIMESEFLIDNLKDRV